MGQVRYAFLLISIFSFGAIRCQKIEPVKNKIEFVDEKEATIAIRRMEYLMNLFPTNYMANCYVDDSGYLFLSSVKVAPLKGAVKNPKVRKDEVFDRFKPAEIDEFFSTMAYLMRNGVYSWNREPSLGKFLYSYHSEEVRDGKDSRMLMVVSNPSDTTESNFKKYFRILDKKGDLVLLRSAYKSERK